MAPRLLLLVAGSLFVCLLTTSTVLAFDPPVASAQAGTQAARKSVEDTSEILVFLEPGTDVNVFANAHGLTVKHALKSDPNAYVLSADTVANALGQIQALHGKTSVRAVYNNQRTCFVRMAFVPDDPYFHKYTPTSPWPGQWHLINEWVTGRDARVEGAWNRDITGAGVTIGICDDSFETTHPDLAPNYVAADSWDFGQNDNTPDPVYSDDEHGISVAGVAAARGGNGIGVTGAAPYANLAGLRIDFPYQTSQMFVDATLYHSSGSNTTIKVKNHSYGYNVPYILTSSEVSAIVTSAAAGTVHCVAAGNNRTSAPAARDSNTQDLQNTPECICVAAMNSSGTYSSYSCFGSCVAVTAPSNGSTYSITTTDRTTETYGYNGSDSFPDSDYTSIFGGTSSSTPLVSGVMALVKQVQPALDVRFAKHLLARTSDIVNSSDTSTYSDGGWRTNAAGFHFNQNYGFGLIDADELTQQAVLYSGVSALTTESTGNKNVNTSIPDASSTGVTRTFTMSDTEPLEEVSVYLLIYHANRGDLEAYLTSPSGYTSRLFMNAPSDTGYNISWTFVTNAFWGENPAGTWSLNVRDVTAGTTGTWSRYNVTTRMGTLVNVNIPPTITEHPSDQTVIYNQTATFTVQASGTAPLYYQWQKNNVDITDGGHYSGTANASLVITPASTDDEADYRCVVTNSLGSETSDSATLTVLLPGDFDDDGDVDQDDFGVLQKCLDTTNPTGDCLGTDLSGDGVTNSVDVEMFTDCMSGPQVPFDPNCLP